MACKFWCRGFCCAAFVFAEFVGYPEIDGRSVEPAIWYACVPV